MVGCRENQKSDDAKDHEKNTQEQASNQEVCHALLVGAGMGDAERGDKGFGEPGEEFQCCVRLRSEYGNRGTVAAIKELSFAASVR